MKVTVVTTEYNFSKISLLQENTSRKTSSSKDRMT